MEYLINSADRRLAVFLFIVPDLQNLTETPTCTPTVTETPTVTLTPTNTLAPTPVPGMSVIINEVAWAAHACIQR